MKKLFIFAILAFLLPAAGVAVLTVAPTSALAGGCGSSGC
jgi:hypothetical protein